MSATSPDSSGLRPLPKVSVSSVRLGVVSALGLAAGLLRESAIAYRFGLGPAYDAFLLASLPFDLLSVVAAIQMSAVQLALSEREHSRGPGHSYAHWRAVSRSLAGTFLGLGIACALLAPFVLSLGFKSLAPGQRHEIAILSMLMIPAPALGGWMAMQSAALNAEHQFLGLPITGILLSLSTAAAALILGSRLGSTALVIGTLVGLIGGIALQHWLCRRAGFVRERGITPEAGAVGDFFRASWPLVGPAVLGRLYLGFERLLAAGLSVGTISALAFATRFATVPVAVLSSVGPPLFALLVGHAVRGNVAEFARAGERGVRVSLFLVAPAILFLILFAEPIVAVLLQRGNFGTTDVSFTASAVQAFAWGIFGWVGADLASRMLWARSRFWASLQLAAAFMVINAAGAVVLRPIAGAIGLATARSVGFGCYLVLALIVVQRHCPGFSAWRVGAALARQIVVALASAGLVALLFERVSLDDAAFAQRFAALAGAAAATAALYLGVEGLLWRSEEGVWVLRLVEGRLRAVATALGIRL